MTTPKIEKRDPLNKQQLRLHPLQKFIPVPETDSDEWRAFVANMSAAGPDGVPPIIITPGGDIINGKRRWLAAKQMAWPEINCQTAAEEDAAMIMIDSMLGQKNVELGTKVYIALMMLPDYVKSAENRRLGNLKRGVKTFEKPLFLPKVGDSPSGESLTSLAGRFGCGPDTVKQAVSVYKLFHDPKCQEWVEFYRACKHLQPPLAELQARQKRAVTEYETLLFAGDKTIWQIKQAIAGALPEMQSGRDGAVLQAQLEFWDKPFEPLMSAAPSWKKLDEAKREQVLDSWRTTLKKLPQDLRDALAEVLDEVTGGVKT